MQNRGAFSIFTARIGFSASHRSDIYIYIYIYITFPISFIGVDSISPKSNAITKHLSVENGGDCVHPLFGRNEVCEV
ncbi:hypothetical protein MRB53_003703 [Persea americana]|uniref:Uncharacterized protein n=1 Tax=Persea americana TaxID=3435 RepID=A0ACC2MY59_PERAE|nr:hypothetical protein MRB53_003703 [Persea americana]